METNGEVIVFSGLSEMGQGFTTGISQVAADSLGVHPDQVTVVVGDTHACPTSSFGTGASRTASVGGASVRKASAKLREKIVAIAAHMLEAAVEDIEAENGGANEISCSAFGRAMIDRM